MKKVKVVAAAIVQEGKLFVALRGPSMSSPGLWELPGGKVELGEKDREALLRECQEELRIDISVGSFLAKSEVAVRGKRIVMSVYLCQLQGGSPQLMEHAAYRWIAKEEISQLKWAPADVGILSSLIKVLD